MSRNVESQGASMASKRTSILILLGLIFIGVPECSLAQIPLGVGADSLRGLHVWAGVDTMISVSRVGGEWREPNGTGYVRTVQRDQDGYRLSNHWFNGAGVTNAIQEYQIGPNGTWPVTVRVRAATDSASLRIMDARVIGWEVPAGEEVQMRLYDFGLENASMPADLGYVMMSGLPLHEGQEIELAYFTLLVPTAPLSEAKRLFRVAGHDTMSVSGRDVRCWVLSQETPRSGTRMTLWASVADGRLMAIRGQPPGGRFEWWHLLKGGSIPTSEVSIGSP